MDVEAPEDLQLRAERLRKQQVLADEKQNAELILKERADDPVYDPEVEAERAAAELVIEEWLHDNEGRRLSVDVNSVWGKGHANYPRSRLLARARHLVDVLLDRALRQEIEQMVDLGNEECCYFASQNTDGINVWISVFYGIPEKPPCEDEALAQFYFAPGFDPTEVAKRFVEQLNNGNADE
jgi:hypothetical protein